MGLGVPDPKGIFGTTLGLQERFGVARAFDMPTAENGMTGVAIGSALVGMRPVMTHQRTEFAMLAIEQIVNQAAKWHYMFGGQASVPLVIRLIVGRGWGQGPQHSQSLHAWFAHIPGLKVVMPASPYDAKGLLLSSIDDNNPVIFIEHRWLYNTYGEVPEEPYRIPLGTARIARPGKDVTIVALSHMVIEALKSAEVLAAAGIDAEVVDLRCVRPLDRDAVLASVRKTGHLLVADIGCKTGGCAGEIVALVCEEAFDALRKAPKRVALMDCPIPTTPALANLCYPGVGDFVAAVCDLLGHDPADISIPVSRQPLDVPDSSFMGPF
jgi:pyruvate/2-oxoglutarate/acetoin dehydrogenase E1 component